MISVIIKKFSQSSSSSNSVSQHVYLLSRQVPVVDLVTDWPMFTEIVNDCFGGRVVEFPTFVCILQLSEDNASF